MGASFILYGCDIYSTRLQRFDVRGDFREIAALDCARKNITLKHPPKGRIFKEVSFNIRGVLFKKRRFFFLFGNDVPLQTNRARFIRKYSASQKKTKCPLRK